MSKKKTHKEFVEELKLVGFFDRYNLLEEYITAKTKIAYESKDGKYQYCQYPSTLLAQEKEKYEQITGNKIIQRKQKKIINNKKVDIKRSVQSKIKYHSRIFPKDAIILDNSERIEVMKKELKGRRPDLLVFPTVRDPNNKLKIYCVCKECGNWFYKTGETLRKGVKCPFCGDTISFNNKLLRLICRKVNADNFIFEYNDKSKFDNFIYDAYFTVTEKDGKIRKIIIEANGEQHYEETDWFRISLTEIKENDRKKKLKAEEQGIEVHYINCTSPKHEDIVKEFQKVLSQFFDIDDKLIKECMRIAEISLIPQICKYYSNNKNTSLKEIGSVFNINETTIIDYLKKGANLGLCIFPDPTRTTKKDRNTKHIMVFDLDGNYQGIEHISINRCVEYYQENYNIKLNNRVIPAICRGQQKTNKNYIFRYPEDTYINKSGEIKPQSIEYLWEKYDSKNTQKERTIKHKNKQQKEVVNETETKNSDKNTNISTNSLRE